MQPTLIQTKFQMGDLVRFPSRTVDYRYGPCPICLAAGRLDPSEQTGAKCPGCHGTGRRLLRIRLRWAWRQGRITEITCRKNRWGTTLTYVIDHEFRRSEREIKLYYHGRKPHYVQRIGARPHVTRYPVPETLLSHQPA